MSSRMTARTREAPMDWEREQDRLLPNIFATTPSSTDSNLHSETAVWGSSASKPRTTSVAGFGSSTISPTEGLEGSNRSTSPLLFSDATSTTAQQRSASTHSMFGNKSKPPTSLPLTTAASRSTLVSPSSPPPPLLTKSRTADVSSPSSAAGTSATKNSQKGNSFHFGRSFTAPLESTTSAEAATIGITRQGTNNHSNNESDLSSSIPPATISKTSSFSSPSASTTLRREGTGRLQLSRSSLSSVNDHYDQSSFNSFTASPHAHSSSPLSSSWWGVDPADLPFILAGYVQLLMNFAIVCVLIYVLVQFIWTIQTDISDRIERDLKVYQFKILDCRQKYEINRCAENWAPDFKSHCDAWKSCWLEESHSGNPQRLGRASLAAETFAVIANSFVNEISYKTMGFVVLVVAGVIVGSNVAFSSYRANHVMMHQHSIVPPSSGGGGGGRGSQHQRQQPSLQQQSVFGQQERSFSRHQQPPKSSEGNAAGARSHLSFRNNTNTNNDTQKSLMDLDDDGDDEILDDDYDDRDSRYGAALTRRGTLTQW